MALPSRRHLRCGLFVALLATTTAHAGINGGGRSAGSITAFGSIFVNGIEYETDAATILVDGVPAAQADLRVGQYVYVDGFVNPDGVSGTASTVVFESDVRGIVTAVDAAAATFTVLGQTVRVNGTTAFTSGGGFGTLRVGQAVEVSGLRDAGGALVATWIEAAGASTDRIVGAVTAHDPALRTFRIGSLLVDYAAAARPEGSVVDGALVEVKGARATGATLLATEVETVAAGLGASAGSSSALEGIVTQAPVGGRLVVGTQAVTLAADVVYRNGTAADLVANARVEIEGVVAADGALVASQVTFEFDDIARTHGVVTALSAAAATLVANGLTVQVLPETRVEDRSRLRLPALRHRDLRVGDTVEVDGFEAIASATVRAKRVQRVDADRRAWVEGVAYGVRPFEFTLVDTVVQTTPRTRFLDVAGRTLTRAQFEALAPGQEVKVRGTWTGASWIADQAQFK